MCTLQKKRSILYSSLTNAKGGIFKYLITYRNIQETSVFWSSCLIPRTTSEPDLQCQISSKATQNSPLNPTDVSTGCVWKNWVVTSKIFHALSQRFFLQNNFEKTCLSSNVFFQQEPNKPLAEWKWKARMTHLDK